MQETNIMQMMPLLIELLGLCLNIGVIILFILINVFHVVEASNLTMSIFGLQLLLAAHFFYMKFFKV